MTSLHKVALIIETSGIYGRRILTGVGEYIRNHTPWIVVLERHASGLAVYSDQDTINFADPKWIAASHWDGVLSRVADPSFVRVLTEIGIPVVDLNDRYDNPEVAWVGSNHRAIGTLAAKQFHSLSIPNFAYSGIEGLMWSDQRLEGFRDTADEYGIDVHVFKTPWAVKNQQYWHSDIAPIMEWIRNLPKPIGIFAPNDMRAVHLISACNQLGIMIPEEVAVLGVNDEEILCDLCTPRLSSVIPDAEQIGYRAAELLDKMMRTGKRIKNHLHLDPRGLSVRQSTDILAVKDQLVKEAVQFIRQRASIGCQVSDLTKKFKISRSALDSRFRKALNRSPTKIIHWFQISLIQKLLLETDYTLEHISEEMGFKHSEYLTVLFKREVGVTPSHYRTTRKRFLGRP